MDFGSTSTPLLQNSSDGLKRDNLANDRISQLPDGILIAILSLLTLEEAATTSILSHRWRYLWMQTTGSWNFHFLETMKMMGMQYRNFLRILPQEASKYINRVNGVLELHCGPYLDELRVAVYIDASTAAQVDQFLSFAIQKAVQKLELDFKASCSCLHQYNYSFPRAENFTHLLKSVDIRSVRQQHHLRGITSDEDHPFRSFCCLRYLCLRYVDITEEVLDYFLSSCLLLEHLCVERSNNLVNLKVYGLHLKCCEILNCFNLKSLEISAANLESFTYIGPIIDVPFRSVPLSLLELTIGGEYVSSFVFESAKHVIYLSQIKTLKIDISYDVNSRMASTPIELPELCNLKRLELKVCGTRMQSLLGYLTFMKASPFLSTFKIEYRLDMTIESLESFLQRIQSEPRISEAAIFVHQHLEEVELVGFRANVTDLYLALRLIDNAVNLKRIALHFWTQTMKDNPAVMGLVSGIRQVLPPGAELVVL